MNNPVKFNLSKWFLFLLGVFLFLIFPKVAYAKDPVIDRLATASSKSEVRRILSEDCNEPNKKNITMRLELPLPDSPPNAPRITMVTDICEDVVFTFTKYSGSWYQRENIYFTHPQLPNIYIHLRTWSGNNDGIRLTMGNPGVDDSNVLFDENGIGAFGGDYTITKDPNNIWDLMWSWKNDHKDELESFGVNVTTVIKDAIGQTLEETLINLLQIVSRVLVVIIQWFLEPIINALLIVNVNQTGIIEGWAAVRNASNILLVLILLFIAFFNAIRFQIEYYTAKALIPRLAIAAVMINFSFFVSRAIVDMGNILTNYFVSKIDWPNLFIPNTVEGFISGVLATGGLIIAGVALRPFLFLVAFVAIVILVAILLIRHAVLYLLTVFSPLVFLTMVLPFTRGLSGQWWNYMTRYSFMGAVISLILFVASEI